jgi:hypothetical protein
MAIKSIDFNIGPLTVELSAASDFWWLDTQSGGLLGKRRTYLLAGIHPMRYERFNAIAVHLLWLRLRVGWVRKGAAHV